MGAYSGNETAKILAMVEGDLGKPQVPSPASVKLTVKDINETTTILAATAMTIIAEDTGLATAADANGVTDAAQAWRVDEWRDAILRVTSGAAVGQERRIKSNTATAIIIDPKVNANGLPMGAFSPAPGIGDTYTIHRSTYFVLWTIPSDQAGNQLKFIVTAEGTSPAYKSAWKEDVAIEEASI